MIVITAGPLNGVTYVVCFAIVSHLIALAARTPDHDLGLKAVRTEIERLKQNGLNREAFEQEVFDAHVRQHLLANKVMPNVLRRKQQSGMVTVEFTIDREGRLLEQGIARSSRVREFNRAAISLYQPGEAGSTISKSTGFC